MIPCQNGKRVTRSGFATLQFFHLGREKNASHVDLAYQRQFLAKVSRILFIWYDLIERRNLEQTFSRKDNKLHSPLDLRKDKRSA